MKVKELIEKLKFANPNADVLMEVEYVPYIAGVKISIDDEGKVLLSPSFEVQP